MIRDGAGEDFLEADFQKGELDFIEDERDLRGFQIINEDINFPKDDNFQGIDFSYGEFEDSKFANAFFYCQMTLTKIIRCTFENCIFTFNNCYGAIFENVKFINCDFIEYNTFTNCLFLGTKFKNIFLSNNVFRDCFFDSNTEFTHISETAITHLSKTLRLTNSNKPELYRAMGEGYLAGQVYPLARKYSFLYQKYLTRYSTQSFREKLSGYVFEYISGYGLRPSRTLITMFIYFSLILSLFWSQLDLSDALLLSAGALFTFGAKAELLNTMGIFFQIIYIISSFIGISLTALFITVLVNIFVIRK